MVTFKTFEIKKLFIINSIIEAGCIENTVLLSECIEMMFFRRRKQIPTNRLMAFVKRLSIIQLQSDPTSALIVLHILRKLINVTINHFI